ncbi:CDP-diacylglycerol diphosphatase [Erwinia phyllosphaerae]|uniref:CDP-diacylglycerol diphosphatase n=1 Tax=Erwinia phyllosphaerae TaxID=2853256 RepID=UPI001FEF3360|nr:CDP-diacylglycerol diphosphatase [Erwinia phyllosphaerae]MBV4368748.1 CDP-diacylglycerol diphosphatase [Erwinia phyllosphaerae]
MQGRKLVLIVVIAAVVAATGLTALEHKNNANALWNIVSQQCIPNQQQNNDATPCRLVDLHNGYVVMKDREGPLQFLLLPVKKITGIESPQLLNPFTPNFFAEAWRARHYMEERRGSPVADSAVALSINSQRGRTQNQLHIHISCLRPDIRRQLDSLNASLNASWQSVQLGKHLYQLRTVTRDELKKTSPFIRVANELPGAREEMGKYGIAVAAMPDGRRVLMVIKRNLLMLNRGSAEELQDHSCAILQPSS